MYFAWIAGLLLFIQQVSTPESLSIIQQVSIPEGLSIIQHGRTIATVNRLDVMPLPGVPLIDIEKYNSLINKLDRQVYQAPINATIDIYGHILPGQVGYMLYRQSFTEQISPFLYGNGPDKIEVPILTVYPKVDSELLANIRVKKIGEYETYFNAYNKNRSHNISLAVKALNNFVLFPGEVFSFNQVVGERTKGKGYMPAPVIVQGEFSEGIGGGICQVSSTLFNAIDNAGLQTIQRYSHTRQVTYVPPGRDATVSWYGPDFTFKNEYNQPILIQAKMYGGIVRIIVHSSDMINNEPRKVPNALNRSSKEIRS